MTESPLRVTRRDDGVVILTLALPDRRNAMTAQLTSAWGETIASLRHDRTVRAVGGPGEGTAFCAGGDLTWVGASPDLAVASFRERVLAVYRTWLSIRVVEAPSIAAVTGHAVGAGLCLMKACALRYAGRGAKLSGPF